MSTQPSNGGDLSITAPDTTPGERTGLEKGQQLAGRYEVDRLIGEGGMGDVYLAKHLKIDKEVAIKVLAPEQTRRPRTVSRFLQEAKACSKIRHDNVVDITDFGEDAGRAFFVMEYLDGEDLSQILKREGRLPWRRTRRIAIQLLEGLGAAHEAGIVHRDVKPHNCFVAPRENNPDFVKVIDFGIAKLRDGSEEQLTRTGAIMGTAEYMSPEQGQGAELDGRSDLYSVGVILFRMLTGEVPFAAGNAMAILYQHVHTEVRKPSEVCPEAGYGEDVDALVAKAMAKDPADRFASSKEFITALRAIDDPGASQMIPTSAPKRSKSLALAAVAVLGIGGVAAWGGVFSGSRDADDRVAVAAGNPANAESGERSKPDAKVGAGSEVGAEPRADAKAEGEPGADAGPEPEPEGAAAEPGAEDAGAEPGAEVAGTEPGAEDAGTEPAAEDEAAASAGTEAEPTEAVVPARRSKRKVDGVLGKLSGKVKACGKKGGLFPGEKVDVSFVIGPDGKPSKVKVSGAHAAAGESCIARAIKRARFGPAQRSQTVEHRYTM